MNRNKINLEIYQNPLMDYLPGYYGISPEEHYITYAEAPELSLLWEGLGQVKANQFITTAYSPTLKKWERLPRLAPTDTAQDLDHRRTVIIIKLSTRAPLTYRWLLEKLTQTVGEENYYVELNHNAYELLICLADEVMALYQELKGYFRETIPANLTLLMATEMEPAQGTLYVGGAAFAVTQDTLPGMAEDYRFGFDSTIRAVLLPGYSRTKLPELPEGPLHGRLYLSAQVFTITTTELKYIN